MREFIMNEDQTPLERRADELRAEVLHTDPKKLAEFTGIQLQDNNSQNDF